MQSKGDGGQGKMVNGPLERRYVSQNSTAKWVHGLSPSVFSGSDNPQTFTLQQQKFTIISILKTVAAGSSEKPTRPQFQNVPRKTPTHRENIKPEIQ